MECMGALELEATTTRVELHQEVVESLNNVLLKGYEIIFPYKENQTRNFPLGFDKDLKYLHKIEVMQMTYKWF